MVKRKKIKFGPARKAYRRGKKPLSKKQAETQARNRNRLSVRAQAGVSKFSIKKVTGGYDIFVQDYIRGGK